MTVKYEIEIVSSAVTEADCTTLGICTDIAVVCLLLVLLSALSSV